LGGLRHIIWNHVTLLSAMFSPRVQQNEKKSGSGGEGGGGAHMPVKHSGTAAAKPAGAYNM
jgi:hypothetical protein